MRIKILCGPDLKINTRVICSLFSLLYFKKFSYVSWRQLSFQLILQEQSIQRRGIPSHLILMEDSQLLTERSRSQNRGKRGLRDDRTSRLPRRLPSTSRRPTAVHLAV